jgi:hypothetical protein
VKFSKAQSVILEEIGNTNCVLNHSQRMRAIQPMLDSNIIKRTVIYGPEGWGIGYHWELV